jgi:sulfate transport system ATP-binding protein
LRRWLRELHDEMGITTVFVTHDQEEALDLADRVAVMNEGRIEQVGTPNQIYEKPKTPFVYDFLGEANKFDCELEDGVARVGNKALAVGRKMRDGPAVAYVRPHDILLRRPNDHSRSDDAMLPGEATVRFVSALGAKAWVELSYQGQLVEAEITREDLAELEISRGKRCRLQLRLPRIYPKTHA